MKRRNRSQPIWSQFMKTVLISEAGIAGPTLAFWLKATEFEPILIERAPALRSGGYVIDFWGFGYTHGTDWGDRSDRLSCDGNACRERCWPALAAFCTRIFTELTNGRYVTLQPADLSRLLFTKINGRIEGIFSDEIVLLEEQPDCVRVELKVRAGSIS